MWGDEVQVKVSRGVGGCTAVQAGSTTDLADAVAEAMVHTGWVCARHCAAAAAQCCPLAHMHNLAPVSQPANQRHPASPSRPPPPPCCRCSVSPQASSPRRACTWRTTRPSCWRTQPSPASTGRAWATRCGRWGERWGHVASAEAVPAWQCCVYLFAGCHCCPCALLAVLHAHALICCAVLCCADTVALHQCSCGAVMVQLCMPWQCSTAGPRPHWHTATCDDMAHSYL